MLLNFEFKNYKSFKESNIIDIGEEKSCLIVGEKMTGKTNAIESIVCCISHIISPIQFIKRKEIKMYKRCIPFLYGVLDEECGVVFKITIKIDKEIYNYSILIKNNQNLVSIEEECLYVNKLKMYDRKKEKIELYNDFKKEGYLTNIDNSMPYISFIAIMERDEKVNKLIEYLQSTILIDSTLNSFILNKYAQRCLLDNKILILKILRTINVNFKDYYFTDNESDQKIVNVYEIRNKRIEIDLMEDASTIQQLFIFLPQIFDSIRKGRLIIIDDIDKKIDKKTLKSIINIFNDENVNKNNSQLIASLNKNNYVKSNEKVIFTIREESLKTKLFSIW